MRLHWIVAAAALLNVPTAAAFSSPRSRSLSTSLSAAATSSSEAKPAPLPELTAPNGEATKQHYDSVIVGGGPAGLLSAIMLAQRNPTDRIAVYDRLSVPPSPTDQSVWQQTDRYYLIGLGHRGQSALKRFGAWDEVEAVSAPVIGRKDWAPGAKPDEGVERLATDKPTTTMVLPRDKLVGVLYKHIMDNYADQVELNYEYQVTPISFGEGKDQDQNQSVTLNVSKCTVNDPNSPTPEAECDVEALKTVTANFLIGADGAARGIANEMEERDAERYSQKNALQRLFGGRPFRVKRFEDDNKRVYKTVPVKVPSSTSWRFDVNYSARSRNNSRITFEALPADDQGTYCALLLMKEDDELAQPNSDPVQLRQFFEEEFSQFSPLIDDANMAQVAAKPASNLPAFRYAGPRINEGDATVLLGDAIHTVKPYYGLGANTALEDVAVLADSLDSTPTLKDAVETFSDARAGEANALVTISRNMDRPGKLGTAAFVLPLILDGIFHKLAPAVFAPNMFAMFQKEGAKFRDMQFRKRADRLAQIGILSSIFYGMFVSAKTLVSLIAKKIGANEAVVAGAMIAAAALLSKVNKAVKAKNADAKTA